MAFEALAIANYFLDKAEECGIGLSPMAIQKLVYFAHGWHLAITDEPLINQRVEAWEFGPVIGDVYREFRNFGRNIIKTRASKWVYGDSFAEDATMETFCVEWSRDSKSKSIVDRVWEVYKGFTAVQLSNLTHTEGSPWSETREKSSGEKHRIINDELIRLWFRAQAGQNAGSGKK